MEAEIQDWFFFIFNILSNYSIKMFLRWTRYPKTKINSISWQILKNHYKPVIKVPVERTFDDEFPRSQPENWSKEIDLTDKNSKPEDIKIKVEASARKAE